MNVATLKRIGTAVLVVVIASAIFGVVLFGLYRLWPRHDQTPVVTARKDEKTASGAAAAVGQTVQTQNDDATLHIDLTTKEIRDAFDAIPAPRPATGSVPQPIPAAPVDRVRDRLNEGIARANRAAGPAGAAD